MHFIDQPFANAASIVDQKAAGLTPPPTLIVCPPTLVSHWAHEIGKFVEADLLQPLQYQGSPKERALLQPLLSQHNVVVASYDSVKTDVGWLSQHAWLYCVLDEGHIIRNPKSRITQVPSVCSASLRLISCPASRHTACLTGHATWHSISPCTLGCLVGDLPYCAPVLLHVCACVHDCGGASTVPNDH